jgi:hypothetical protein
MAAAEAEETRYLRVALAWVGVVIAGLVLLWTPFLGVWPAHVCQPGAESSNPSPCPMPWTNWIPPIVFFGSIAWIALGIAGLLRHRRSYRRRVRPRIPDPPSA